MDSCYKTGIGGIIMKKTSDKMLQEIYNIMEREHCDIREATSIWLLNIIEKKQNKGEN